MNLRFGLLVIWKGVGFKLNSNTRIINEMWPDGVNSRPANPLHRVGV